MNNDMYSGKVVLISGGARGFGAEYAKAFAEHGATAVIGDINTELGQTTAKGLADSGLNCRFIPLDVRDDAAWERAVRFCVEECGGLDVVINNAGIELSELMADSTPEQCLDLFNINLVGTMLGIKHAFQAMRPEGMAGNGGAILNMASVAALTTTPGLSAYSASKAGVVSLTQMAAAEAGLFQYGIRANCLCPSLFDTDMGRKLLEDFPQLGLGANVEEVKQSLIARIPVGRFGELSDVVNAALYLCSDDAVFINGVALPVDGGMAAAS